ncbi:hypothetical protein VHEMI05852 [[Torrubiella] hemipterigena]|uniref:Uncharacterized protein n=1 Tax=[Torrubiella] hemipterigena TaxID=1531966 RepID=A0A0A1TI02_9HYPO|nr:hypothetical protein VHEMI05852 [[Torrubiella] hemipterigena]
MAAKFFSERASLEILCSMLECVASPNDVLAFALTCRHMADAWHVGNTGVLTVWRIWQEDMPAVEEALIAVRVTELVYDTECQGVPHPESIDPSRFTSNAARPTARELGHVWLLHSLALGLEGTLRSPHGFDDYHLPSGVNWDQQQTPGAEQPERLAEWRVGFHRAAYRCLIAGAVLAYAYSEPLYQCGAQETVNDEQSILLSGFPAYNIEASMEEQDAIFGPFADWLLENILANTAEVAAITDRFDKRQGRAWCCRDLQSDDEDAGSEDELDDGCPVQLKGRAGIDSHAQAHYVAWEVMKMLWQQEHILLSMYNSRFPHHKGQGSSEKSCIIAPFGLFCCAHVDIITPPARYAPQLALDARDPNDSKRPMDIFSVLDIIGPKQDHLSQDAVPAPLELQFFRYFLQKHLGLSFWEDFFDTESRYAIEDGQNWTEFMKCLQLFALDDVPNRWPSKGLSTAAGADFIDGTEFLVKAR